MILRGAGSRDERHTSAAGGQLDANQLSGRISHASGADELLSLFAAHRASLNHILAANLWNKLGKQQIERLVQRTLDLVSSCRARELANVAHGVANCRLQAMVVHPLFVAVAEAAVSGGLAGFNPQDLANTVWAYATAGVAADALYAAVAQVAVRGGLAGFTPQNLANTVWGRTRRRAWLRSRCTRRWRRRRCGAGRCGAGWSASTASTWRASAKGFWLARRAVCGRLRMSSATRRCSPPLAWSSTTSTRKTWQENRRRVRRRFLQHLCHAYLF